MGLSLRIGSLNISLKRVSNIKESFDWHVLITIYCQLFIYALLNDAVKSSHCRALNVGMINEWIWNDMEGNKCGLIRETVPKCTRRDRVKLRRTSIGSRLQSEYPGVRSREAMDSTTGSSNYGLLVVEVILWDRIFLNEWQIYTFWRSVLVISKKITTLWKISDACCYGSEVSRLR
jgi:hypothetical protein